MKHKTAISVDVDILKWVDKEVQTGRFRNKSHAFEQCVRVIRDRKII